MKEKIMKYSPYSFSKISSYLSCPNAFKFKYIKKIKIVSDPRFFEKGNFYHERLETYPVIKDFKWKYADENLIETYTENIENFIKEKIVQKLLENKMCSEAEFKFNESLKLYAGSKWKSFLYGYIDFISKIDDTIFIVDWKSKDHGDRYPTNPKQLEMYAAWIFEARKHINKVVCMFAYIENKTFKKYVYTREDSVKFKDEILSNINKIEQDNKFAKHINKKCTGCDYYDLCKPFQVKVK